MLKCGDCGWKGSFEELRRVEESRGEFWGMPAYETMYYCPCCGSEYVDDEENFDDDYDEEDEDPSLHEAYLESDPYFWSKEEQS